MIHSFDFSGKLLSASLEITLNLNLRNRMQLSTFHNNVRTPYGTFDCAHQQFHCIPKLQTSTTQPWHGVIISSVIDSAKNSDPLEFGGVDVLARFLDYIISNSHFPNVR